MSTYAQQLTQDLIGIARDYVRSEVRVTLESNLLPAIPVYSGAMSGGTGAGAGGRSLADLLGIRAGLVVRNAKGEQLATFGNPAPVDPLRALILAGILAGAGYLVWRAVR